MNVPEIIAACSRESGAPFLVIKRISMMSSALSMRMISTCERKTGGNSFRSMAILTHMKKSFTPHGLSKMSEARANTPDKLDLPVAPDFVSWPPIGNLDKMLQFNEDLKEWYPDSRPTPEERLACKVHAEFIL
jgi:hypothetical protein